MPCRIAIKIDPGMKQPSLTPFPFQKRLHKPHPALLLAAFLCEPSLQPGRCAHNLWDLRMTCTATGQLDWRAFYSANRGVRICSPTVLLSLLHELI